MRAGIVLFCASFALAAGQPAPAGTGEISGVVWSADQTPQPIRHAVVSLAGGGLPSTRSVITNDAGQFAFARLPVGSFTVVAKKAAYLAAAYGSPRPGRAGSSIVLAAGQRLAVNITMFRGAVIAGQLRDSSGGPVSGVTVSALDARTPSLTAAAAPVMTPIETVATDDRGMYRIYGLLPGEYLITAAPSPGGAGEIGTRSVSDMDTLLSALTQRRNGGQPSATSAAYTGLPPIPPPPSVGYAAVYFPGTALYSEAATVRVAAGEERAGVNFEVSHVSVASITGVVTGNIPNPAAVQLSLVVGGPRTSGLISTMGITSSPPNARGEFCTATCRRGSTALSRRSAAAPPRPS